MPGMILSVIRDFTPDPPSLPVLALGTWALGGEGPWGYGPCDAALARETIQAALSLGCRHFDTAALFGDGAVERLLGETVSEDTEVITRVGCRMHNGHPVADFTPEHVRRAVEESARRLRRVPDVVLLHTPPISVLRAGKALDALLTARDAGACRAAGVSVFEPEEALLALARGIDRVCIPYNPANRKAEAELFPAARARRVRVQAREVLHNGRLTDHPRPPEDFAPFDVRKGWPPFLLKRLEIVRNILRQALPEMNLVQACVGYALGHPAVSAVSVGCRGAGQVRAVWARPIPLPPELRERVDTALYADSGGPSPSHLHSDSMRSISSSDRP